MTPAAEQLLRGALDALARMRGATAGAVRSMLEVALSLEHAAPVERPRTEQARAAAKARWDRPRASPEHARSNAPASPEQPASLSLFSDLQEPKRETEHAIGACDVLPTELADVAKREGVHDVATCWRKFCAHHAGRRVPVAGRWLVWVLNERNRAPPATASEARPRIDARAKERTADQAHAALERERAGPGLVRASIAAVLEQLGRPPPAPEACAS